MRNRTSQLVFPILLISILCTTECYAQARIDSLAVKLDILSAQIPGLNHELELSVNDTPIKDFIRSIATLTSLNISIENNLNHKITNNFVNVPAKDVLLFLCKNMDLDLNFTGTIINIGRWIPPAKPIIPRQIKIYHDTIFNKFTLDLKNENLNQVARQLTKLSDKTVICSPDIVNKEVSLYVRDLSVEQALEKLAVSNQLEIVKSDSVSFIIKGITIEPVQDKEAKTKTGLQKLSDSFEYNIYDKDHIDIYSLNQPINDIIELVSKELNLSYFITSKIEGSSNLNLINATYDELLTSLFKGTKYTFNCEYGIYLIGERDQEGIRETKIIKLMYRSVVKLSEVIPEALKKDISISEFLELNSFIVSGSVPIIAELEKFIKSIDQVVPLIYIEVIIIDNQSGYTITTGISAGVGDEPVTSGGKLFPGADYTFGGESINKLLNSFNGFGALNLGKVNPNFYLSMKALEESGLIKIRSTPKLSTLNGHEANLTIGNTEYYLDEQQSLIINQSTQQNTVSQYKPVKADFILKVLPVANGNEEITLDITVKQSDFTARISENAPPGLVTREFTSLVRVKNEEMILLGGLEEKKSIDTRSGVPFLSRVPILKWIFSNKKKEKKDNKLNLFIKPTIIY